MRILMRAVLATVCWLGFFEPHLIQPLAVLPLERVLGVLTGADLVLWLVTFGAVWAGLELFDRWMVPRRGTLETWRRR